MAVIINTENVTIVSDQAKAPKTSKKNKKKRVLTEEQKIKNRARANAWRIANPERSKARCKAWNEVHKNDPEFKEKKRAYGKAYREANRDACNARARLCYDRKNHAHIEGYIPSGEYKQGFSIRNVTSKGCLYIAFDQSTGALKIGCTQCTPDKRLSYYKKQSDSIAFLKTSQILSDAYEAEKIAHAMLRGNVRHVRTDNKFKTSASPKSEWFQLCGIFNIEDIIRVFNTVSEQFACNEDKEIEG